MLWHEYVYYKYCQYYTFINLKNIILGLIEAIEINQYIYSIRRDICLVRIERLIKHFQRS
jgi:hypothetical protein